MTKKIVFASLLLALACSSGPVKIGIPNALTTKPSAGEEVTTSATACGYQLFDAIPIETNETLQRAMREVQYKAHGAYVKRIDVEQSWYYGFIGTVLCNTVTADLIRPTDKPISRAVDSTRAH